ncbi:MAG: DUF4402 domain-containing protein [Micavibrio sp.]
MKMNKFLMMSAVALTVTGIGITQSYAVDDDLTINAEVIATLQIDCTTTQVMHFGEIDPGLAGGTIVLATDGTITTYGGDTGFGGGTAPQQGQCDLTGEANRAFVVTIGATTIDDAGAGVAMAVNNFQVDDGTGAGPAVAGYVANLVGGSVTLDIGADLVVNATQLAGSYTGTVNVDAVYQ